MNTEIRIPGFCGVKGLAGGQKGRGSRTEVLSLDIVEEEARVCEAVSHLSTQNRLLLLSVHCLPIRQVLFNKC